MEEVQPCQNKCVIVKLGLRSSMINCSVGKSLFLAACRRQSLPVYFQIKIQNSRFLLQHHVCLPVAMLSAMIIMNSTSATIIQLQLNVLIQVALVILSVQRNKTQIRKLRYGFQVLDPSRKWLVTHDVYATIAPFGVSYKTDCQYFLQGPS